MICLKVFKKVFLYTIIIIVQRIVMWKKSQETLCSKGLVPFLKTIMKQDWRFTAK
ncbi:hypothetical protein HMPREF0083_04048 [Aneurinibacillus aneurinilyticus ATCC 12856]|uniref:Uncharacterized protein n=1 Tax=Aneurinibacillus aneurinilyticus ATCC 12856 TaxID=649747 RepID=U1X018_ANEAE|nr:hypothetical protein HMPREF0083_04048 [Aneurinibacillus aneurinilyticus ATCC 12856]